jgi:predicted nucleic acid-binding protein
MTILVDTNVLLRVLEVSHSQHHLATSAVASLRSNGHRLVVTPQVVYELWVVATRPTAKNGLGLSANRAAKEIESIRRLYAIVHDDKEVFDAWCSLMTKYHVLGKTAHDAHLVAAMIRHGITHLLTFNAGDFARFAEITVVAPRRGRGVSARGPIVMMGACSYGNSLLAQSGQI